MQWETYNEKWFKYHCVIDGRNAQYSVKGIVLFFSLQKLKNSISACLDPVGEVLPVGKSRSYPDGETFTCFIERDKVKLNHQTSEQNVYYHALVPANYVIVRPNGDIEI